MKKSKLISLLNTLDKSEFNRFKAFANSPYFNTNKTIVRFLNFLERYMPKKLEKTIDRKVVFAKVYPGLEYNEGTLTVLRSQTLGLLEDFLVEESFAKDKKMRQKYLAESYETKGLTERYRKKFLNYEKINESDSDYFREAHQFYILSKKLDWVDYEIPTEKVKSIKQGIENLDIFYLNLKLRYKVIQVIYERYIGVSSDFSFLEETFSNRVSLHAQKHKAIDLYPKLINILYHEDISLNRILDYKKYFFSVEKNLLHKDRYIIHSEIQNYLSRNVKKIGKEVYLAKFNTYLTAIEKGIIGKELVLNYVMFLDIARIGSVAGRFAEVNRFISENMHKMSPKYQEQTAILARAEMLRFVDTEEAWTEIEVLLSNFQHPDVSFKMNARLLFIKSLYRRFAEDKSFSGVLISNINAHKSFLKREKISLRRFLKNRMQFSNFLLKIVNVKMKEDYKDMKARKELLLHQIESDKDLSKKLQEWLLSLL